MIGTTSALILGGLMGGGALAGSALSSSAAGKAADTQADAAERAAQAQLEASKYWADKIAESQTEANRIAELQSLLGYQQQLPYQQVGTGALLTLQDLLQPQGYLAEAAPEFQFDVSKVAQEPGYDFALQEGLKAIERGAAARGTLLSGATSKALSRYGTDYATSKINDVFNRNLTEYGTNINTQNLNRTNLFNRLSSLAGTGQQAAGASAGLGDNVAGQIGQNLMTGTGNMANIGMAGSQAASDYLTSGTAARASGYASQGNIWGNTLGQLSQLPAILAALRG